MSHDISHLPDPQNREAQDWVDYLKIMYSATMQGETVSANGRSVSMPPMVEIKKELIYWQNELKKETVAKAQSSSSSDHPLNPITLS